MRTIERSGKVWKESKTKESGFHGWRTTVRLHPSEARNICQIYDSCMSEEDSEGEETNVYCALASVGVHYDGEVINIEPLKTTKVAAVLVIYVSCVRFVK